MLKLPKVLKTAKRAIASVAIAMGVMLTGVPSGEAHAVTVQVHATQPDSMNQGALLLVQGGIGNQVLSYHYSHSSHSSHASHSSHSSHYSSRY